MISEEKAVAAHIVWLRAVLKELGIKQNRPTTLHIDNQTAIRLAGNPINHAKSKHIDIKHHIFRERIASGENGLEYVGRQPARGRYGV